MQLAFIADHCSDHCILCSYMRCMQYKVWKWDGPIWFCSTLYLCPFDAAVLLQQQLNAPN